jgi:hypothetical protein
VAGLYRYEVRRNVATSHQDSTRFLKKKDRFLQLAKWLPMHYHIVFWLVWFLLIAVSWIVANPIVGFAIFIGAGLRAGLWIKRKNVILWEATAVVAGIVCNVFTVAMMLGAWAAANDFKKGVRQWIDFDFTDRTWITTGTTLHLSYYPCFGLQPAPYVISSEGSHWYRMGYNSVMLGGSILFNTDERRCDAPLTAYAADNRLRRRGIEYTRQQILDTCEGDECEPLLTATFLTCDLTAQKVWAPSPSTTLVRIYGHQVRRSLRVPDMHTVSLFPDRDQVLAHTLWVERTGSSSWLLKSETPCVRQSTVAITEVEGEYRIYIYPKR